MVVDNKWFEEQIKRLKSLDEKYSVSIELTVENKKHDGVDVKTGIEYYDIDSFKCNINSRPKMDPAYKTICIVAILAFLAIVIASCTNKKSYSRTDVNLVNTTELKNNKK